MWKKKNTWKRNWVSSLSTVSTTLARKFKIVRGLANTFDTLALETIQVFTGRLLFPSSSLFRVSRRSLHFIRKTIFSRNTLSPAKAKRRRMPWTPPPSNPEGITLFRNFKVGRKLGDGSQGVVHAIVDTTTGTETENVVKLAKTANPSLSKKKFNEANLDAQMLNGERQRYKSLFCHGTIVPRIPNRVDGNMFFEGVANGKFSSSSVVYCFWYRRRRRRRHHYRRLYLLTPTFVFVGFSIRRTLSSDHY